jgi:hypothetical protein
MCDPAPTSPRRVPRRHAAAFPSRPQSDGARTTSRQGSRSRGRERRHPPLPRRCRGLPLPRANSAELPPPRPRWCRWWQGLPLDQRRGASLLTSQSCREDRRVLDGRGVVDVAHRRADVVRSDATRTLSCVEYILTRNPESPGWDYLASGRPDLPFMAGWMHARPRRMTLNQEAADMASAWLAKYDVWPRAMAPLHLRPMTAEDPPSVVGER